MLDDINKQTEAAFSSASDTTKLLINLATGVLAIEVTFIQGVFRKVDEIDKITKCFISISWLFLIGSLFAGIWTLYSLTGLLSKDSIQKQSAINNDKVAWPAIWQLILFLLGILFTVIFGLQVIWFS